ncbi:MAG: class I SAM-dependent methyltransferase [Paracoccaceae bacterium]|nr:class I SAM-dependent methyltransferase [Paracoccaceae bacterium]MDG2260247.1 class I SAM-dependent methyltransferase [Paracoccaceae bacterium]
MSDDGFFNDDIAANYDDVHGRSDTESVRLMVRLLDEFAKGGTALEFAIGTGRIALPLLEMGVAAKGVEKSKAMVKQLQEGTRPNH